MPAMRLAFVDGSDHRVAEIRALVPELELEIVHLPSGYSTSAPDPGQRAHDKVIAAGDDVAALAEGVDLVTMDGRSLRLELDSENENRFCRYWRETAVRLLLCVAVRRGPGAPIELFRAECEGRIADKPAGPRTLGWDRLFVPAEQRRTLAELSTAIDPVGLRALAYGDVAAALGLASATTPT
jgi:inosine/xanthosine triphosphate pyrophosphatase family protein